MSYTINPNAKNKWARNAENTMDLSIETDASSVYLDNGRTLEQELGEGSMVSNVATVDNSMSKVIDGTLDGAYESCVFKGKSLVNLITHYDISLTSASKIETGFKFNAMVQDFDHKIGILNVAKPNTYYTYIFTSDTAFEYYTGWDATNGESWNYPTHQAVVGLNILRVKTEANATKTSLLFRTTGNRVGNKDVNLTNFMLLEGDHTNQDISYFEGLCDVKMPILRNVGKNLSDGKLETGRYTQAEGEKFTDASAVRTINKIKVKPSTKYCLRTMDGTTIYNISEYHDGTYIGYKASGSSLVFTTSPTTNELHISFKTNNINLQYQLEEGSIATTYEDHKSNILHTPEIVILRSLPNGVRDELNLKTGEYIKRIGEIILDGDEDWKAWESNDTHCKLSLANYPSNMRINGQHTTRLVCDKLKIGNDRAGVINDNFMASVGNVAYTIIVGLELGKLTSADVAGFKQWLKENPLTVQYELAEPITTIVESLTTPFAYQNGHVILESGHEGQSLLPTLEYSTVVNKTGQIENVAKTIQRQEKQLTMLEQMLIQNIINLDYNNTLLTLKNEMEEML